MNEKNLKMKMERIEEEQLEEILRKLSDNKVKYKKILKEIDDAFNALCDVEDEKVMYLK